QYSVYSNQVFNLHKQNVNLSRFHNEVTLLINVATYLNYSYLHQHFNGRNFSVLAFPCDQFHLEEPGEDSEILNGLMYVRPGNGYVPHPKLNIFGKIKVNGRHEHTIYKNVKASCPPTTLNLGSTRNMYWNPVKSTDITWNFNKFLLDKNGVPRYRISSDASPTSLIPYITTMLSE
uniref:Glutathione peroxidase n=1 Tax=Ciona intestinalis TaxID=7719 RepID=H2XPC7_CIOIN